MIPQYFKGFLMLKQLAKQDEKWREIAYSLCGDKTIADDIVQEMYLRRYENDHGQNITDSYIISTLKSIYLNSIKTNKTISLNTFHYLKSQSNTFELDDYESRLLEKVKTLDWKDQELLTEIYDRSFREIEKEYPLINYTYAYRRITLARQTVLNNK